MGVSNIADDPLKNLMKSDVFVPLRLLHSNKIRSTAKVVWIVWYFNTLQSPTKLVSTQSLAQATGFSRNTVRRCRIQLHQEGWSTQIMTLTSPNSDHKPYYNLTGESTVAMPIELLMDRNMNARAKIIYGFIVGIASEPTKQKRGSFTYKSLSHLVQWDRRTVARAVRELVRAGWLDIDQTNQKAKIYFTVRHPRHRAVEAQLKQIRRRINAAPFKGEAIMREFLTLIVDSDLYQDNATPGYLVNPLTQEHLQLDRFYPPNIAFEFNGPQHYGPTQRFTEEEAAQQRTRDLIKLGICASKGITLVVVHPEDLQLEIMLQKAVGLPHRDLTGLESIVNFLQRTGRSYGRSARRWCRGQFS